MTHGAFQRVLQALGYAEAKGYLRASDLPMISRHRHAFSQAFRTFGIHGVFGLHRRREDKQPAPDFLPLVYVAEARSVDEAKEVHRQVWSQGIVPFLIVVVDGIVWRCNGLTFSRQNWETSNAHVSVDTLLKSAAMPSDFSHLTARALRTSVVWSDGEMPLNCRVDHWLLSSLEGLMKAMTSGDGGRVPVLPSRIANPLIGRFLYLRFLRDRRVLPAAWLGETLPRHASDTEVAERLWKTLGLLEGIFNGSIFPITQAAKARIKPKHMVLLQAVLLDDCEYVSGSGVQLSFRDFRFGSIRTETLSAVYELFLHSSTPSTASRKGAFYTPPMLVDYVLNKVEGNGDLLGESSTILDCSAGSGAFLVGAFRRVIETRLVGQKSEKLPLKALHKILLDQIWGIEPNSDACHVAAFSLYLTLLDYIDENELAEAISGKVRSKIFPSIVDRNILVRDFFARTPTPPAMPAKFSVIVANPPWERPDSLSKAAEKALSNRWGDDIEPPRDSWRLQLLREWSHEQVEEVYA